MLFSSGNLDDPWFKPGSGQNAGDSFLIQLADNRISDQCNPRRRQPVLAEPMPQLFQQSFANEDRIGARTKVNCHRFHQGFSLVFTCEQIVSTTSSMLSVEVSIVRSAFAYASAREARRRRILSKGFSP